MIKDELYNMWKLLRCLMDDEDIRYLITTNPEYKDVTIDSKPEEVIQACLDLSNVMVHSIPPNIDKAIPLRR